MKSAHISSSQPSSMATSWHQPSSKGTVVGAQALTPENSSAENYHVAAKDPVHLASPTSSAEAHQRRHTRLSIAVNKPVQVAIVGAGPYGLSIAAHLRACGIRFRIFG